MKNFKYICLLTCVTIGLGINATVLQAKSLSYGPTNKWDTLWSVAKKFRTDPNISMGEMMQRIKAENSFAFKNNHLNSLMAGYTLTLSQKNLSNKNISKNIGSKSFSNKVINSALKNLTHDEMTTTQPIKVAAAKIDDEQNEIIIIEEDTQDKPQAKGNSDDEIIILDDSDEKKPEDDEIILLDDSQPSGVANDQKDPKTKALDKLYGLYSNSESQQNSVELGYNLQLEQQMFEQSVSSVEQLSFLHLDAEVNWTINSAWNIKLGARVDAHFAQSAHAKIDDNDVKFDYMDNYIRYKTKQYRVTAGTQVISWGRMDNSSPTDRLTAVDASRGVLAKWGDNYRATNALRGEIFFDKSKLDLVYIPRFRSAEIADADQIWSPINYINGRVLGLEKNPGLAALLVSNNTVLDDSYKRKSAFGLRFSSTLDAVDFAATIQRTQLAMPYYRFVPTGPTTMMIVEEHPESWLVGGDVAFEYSSMTVRFEAAWLSDTPMTTKTLQYKTDESVDWAAGIELYPGDGDTRLNLQFSIKHLLNKEAIIDRDNARSLSGSLESEFSNGKWKLNTRFSYGLDMQDIYVSPEISYHGWKSTEIYAGLHYLDGDDMSLAGFYKDNSLLTLGVKISH